MLQDLSRFHEVHSIHDLPCAIVKLCAEDGHIADPGQNWNATDAIMDPTLPAKRLIWAAAGGEYYVVHYERGGIAHTFHILIAKLMKDDAKTEGSLECRWSSAQRLRGICRCNAKREVG